MYNTKPATYKKAPDILSPVNPAFIAHEKFIKDETKRHPELAEPREMRPYKNWGGADMNDPKYQFCAGDKLLHREGGYFIPAAEPVMVLRGKDVTVLAAVIAYIEALEEMNPHPTVDDHLAGSMERLHTIYNYQIENSSIVGVGCSQVHHSGSELILQKAYSKLVELGYVGETKKRGVQP